MRNCDLPTYPAPTQQMFFTQCTPPPFEYNVASNDPLPFLWLCRLPTASSRASCSFKACKTGLNVRLPSGVVGAVEMSRRLSSESTVEAGCWNMMTVRIGVGNEGKVEPLEN